MLHDNERFDVSVWSAVPWANLDAARSTFDIAGAFRCSPVLLLRYLWLGSVVAVGGTAKIGPDCYHCLDPHGSSSNLLFSVYFPGEGSAQRLGSGWHSALRNPDCGSLVATKV